MRFLLFYIFLLTYLGSIGQTSQNFADQVPELKRYNPTEVIDAEYGIQIYDKLIFNIGGDSVRFGKKGYNVQGWMEDYYIDGSVLHKGFYQDGQLKAFKNFYPNGVMERSFRITDMKHCEMVCYYQDGKIKSEMVYYEANIQKQTDYYENGVISYAEENEKNNEYLFRRNSYKDNGTPLIIFEIVDKKKLLYTHKEYYEDGKLKEEGSMMFLEGDYTKEGQWISYDTNGKATKKEKYHKGMVID